MFCLNGYWQALSTPWWLAVDMEVYHWTMTVGSPVGRQKLWMGLKSQPKGAVIVLSMWTGMEFITQRLQTSMSHHKYSLGNILIPPSQTRCLSFSPSSSKCPMPLFLLFHSLLPNLLLFTDIFKKLNKIQIWQAVLCFNESYKCLYSTWFLYFNTLPNNLLGAFTSECVMILWYY